MNALVWLDESALGAWIRESEWGYPIVLIAHTVGMACVVGGVLTFDFRVFLNRAQTTLSWFDAIFKVAWIGFAVNLTSGLVLFAGAPQRFVANPAFQVKLASLAAGAFSVWLLARRIRAESVDSVATRNGTRAIAVVSILFWFGAVAAGRLMAYIR